MSADKGCLNLADAHHDFQFIHVSTKAFTILFSEVQKRTYILLIFSNYHISMTVN